MALYKEYYEDLAVLGFSTDQQANSVTLSELSTRFRKLALTRHPDKPGGNHKEFLKLYAAYKRLGICICKKVNKNKEMSVEDEELYSFFKQFNSEEQKRKSTVILIEENLVQSWETVLSKHYGKPKIIYSNKVPTGKKWDIIDYKPSKVINGSVNPVYITKYDQPKSDGRSKLHIQGKGYIMFTAYQLPLIYKKVSLQYKIESLKTSSETEMSQMFNEQSQMLINQELELMEDSSNQVKTEDVTSHESEANSDKVNQATIGNLPAVKIPNRKIVSMGKNEVQLRKVQYKNTTIKDLATKVPPVIHYGLNPNKASVSHPELNTKPKTCLLYTSPSPRDS